MSIKKYLFISFLEKYLTVAMNFAGVMIMARLLTPREVGIYSVAAAVTGIAQMLRDFGVGHYLIQERDLTQDKIRAALTITCLTSWTIGGALYLIRPWAADFYHEPGLEQLIAVQCLNFLILPLSAPILALLHRDMQFAIIFRINLLSGITQQVISISLAASGHGYMSMAWGSVASLMATVLLVTANRPKQAWVLPGFKEWRHIARFGVQTSIAGIVAELAMNMNDLVLGRFLGFQSVALYSRAQGLMYLFHRDLMDAVRKVAFPTFAQAVRDKQDLLKAYLLAVNHVTVFAWPFYAFLGLYAQPIVRIMFGDQWDTAVPLVQILVFAGAIAALWNLFHNALMATGHVNKILRIELITQTVRIGLVIYAAMISTEATCYALIAIYTFHLFVSTIYLKQAIKLTLFKLLHSNINSLFTTLFSMILPVYCYYYLPKMFDPFLEVVINGFGLLVGWLVGIFVTRHPIKNVFSSKARATG